MKGLHAAVRLERPGGFVLDAEIRADPGTTVALLGPNGAGKSTLVWALAGIEPIHQGRVELGGRVLEDPSTGAWVPPHERRIGVVFQDGLLFPHLTVAQNVAFAAVESAGSRQAAAASAARWLDLLGIGDLADMKPSRLSGGQAQRAGLARALATEPQMLLLDEPLSALDVSSRIRVRRTLSEHLSRFGGPRLLVTHDPVEAALLADRVILLENGRVSQQGRADEILHRPRSQYAADLAGLNLIRGTATEGEVVTAGPTIRIADREVAGDVLLTIAPRTISLYPDRPEGSPRNTWQSRVVAVEAYSGLCRVVFAEPLPLTAEITQQARDGLGLEPGTTAWVAIKATEIGVEPA